MKIVRSPGHLCPSDELSLEPQVAEPSTEAEEPLVASREGPFFSPIRSSLAGRSVRVFTR